MKNLAITAIALLGLLWLLMPRSKPEAKEIVKAAETKAETATKEAMAAETKAIAARPKVQAAKAALQEAAETRIAPNLGLDGLPGPLAAEFETMRGYIAALEIQLDLEARRGDMWKEAALAQKELVAALQEQQAALIKAERRKGLAWGAAGGAAAAILLVALL
jgi:hypothetical protein